MMSSGRPARSETSGSPDDGRTGGARRLARRLLVAAVAATALATIATLPATPARAGSSAGPSGSSARTTVPTDVLIVQANIYTGLSVERFQADVRTVLARKPDFVTYNEVPFRRSDILAPPGYALYRDTRNRFTAATPVAWRTDRWSMVDAGTYRISNWRGVPPGRKVELGRRFVNWVTLSNAEGRVLSVVSVHVAPLVKGMPDLRRHSVQRLAGLVETLRASGPVLVGGDFNFHYKSGIYPRDVLTEAELAPTYDTLASYFATGDHRGMTIDYVFNRGLQQLTAVKHRPVELNSDHDAVVGGFDWMVDPPSQIVRVTNDPDGDLAARRAALRAFTRSLHQAPAGATVEIATTRFDLAALLRQVRAALDRGVHVRVTVNSAWVTVRERRLERAILASGDAGSRFRRCADACSTQWQTLKLPKGLMMVSDAEGSWIARHDMSRMLSPLVLTSRTTATTWTGVHGLARGAQMIDAIG